VKKRAFGGERSEPGAAKPPPNSPQANAKRAEREKFAVLDL
jgi:hypothetical protein